MSISRRSNIFGCAATSSPAQAGGSSYLWIVGLLATKSRGRCVWLPSVSPDDSSLGAPAAHVETPDRDLWDRPGSSIWQRFSIRARAYCRRPVQPKHCGDQRQRFRSIRTGHRRALDRDASPQNPRLALDALTPSVAR